MRKNLVFCVVSFAALIFASCGSSDTPHEHTYSKDWSYDNTYHYHEATCGDTSEVKDKEKHNFTMTETQPTYEHDGEKIYTCTVCGYSYSETTQPKLVHHYDEEWHYSDGSGHYHMCVDPGYETLKSPVEEHTYHDEVIAPTYETGGYTIHTCTVCGYSFNDSETAPKEHHFPVDYEHDENKHWKTCTDEGYEYIVAYEGAHQYHDEVVEPNYDRGGYTRHTCTICGYFFDDTETPQLVHKYSPDWSVDEEKGTHYHACIDVGYEHLRDEEALHDFSDWIIDVPAKYKEDGLKHRTCNTCQYKEEEVIQGYDGTPDEYFNFELSEDETYYIISKGNSEEVVTDLVIPSYHNELPVKEIKTDGFEENDDLVSVTIPDTVEVIRNCAFYRCKNIANVSLSEGLKTIEEGAFSYSKVTLFEIPASVEYAYDFTFEAVEEVTFLGESNVKYIGCAANRVNYHGTLDKWLAIENRNNDAGYHLYFDGSEEEVKHLILPSTITSLGDKAFENCVGLKTVTFPDELETLGENCFHKCKNLYKVNINETSHLKTFADFAFYSCYSLSTFLIPSEMTSIGKGTFNNCYHLKEVIKISTCGTSWSYYDSYTRQVIDDKEDSKLSIVNDDFFVYTDNDNEYLTNYIGEDENITTPELIDSVDYYGLSYNTTIKTVTLHEGLTKIDECAFKDSSNLVGVDLPESLTELKDYAFWHCSSLESIVIPSKITVIPELGFAECEKLETVSILGDVTLIKEDAFNKCYELKAINLPDTLETIDKYAFYECRSLQKITLPKSLTKINTNAFYYCTNLLVVVNKSSLVVEPGSSANGFVASCAVLVLSEEPTDEELYEEDGYILYKDLNTNEIMVLKYVGEETELTIPEGTVEIKSNAIPSTVTKVSVPDTIRFVRSNALPSTVEKTQYDNCMYIGNENNPYVVCMNVTRTSIVTVSFNPNCLVIADQALKGCKNMTSSISIMYGSVITIGKEAFSGCVYTNAIYLGDSVQYIDDKAFYDCNRAYTLEVGKNLEHIGDYAFYYSHFRTITLPVSVKYIGAHAFDRTYASEFNYEGTKAEWNEIYLGDAWYNDANFECVICTDGEIELE